MEELTAGVKDAALGAGADAVGITTVEPFVGVADELAARVESGLSGPLRFTYADPETAADPRATFGWAERLVALGRAYVPPAGRPSPGPGRGHVARFATADHYEPLLAVADAVAGHLRDAGWRAEAIADDPRLVDRAVAVRAGVGWWGKNSLVIAPGVGPWMLLAAVATDAELALDEPMQRSCGTCAACLPACPTGALVAPGVLDARRCLATWLQSPGDLPLELREAIGGRIYGCDDCLDACPPGIRLAAEPSPDPGHDLLGLLALGDAELVERFAHFYIPRRQGRYLRRNLVVALANTGTPEHLPVLIELARHRSALVRRHAVWGVARLARRHGLEDRGADALTGLAADETVGDVSGAIVDALATLNG